ncbi:GMC family oxidoreductase [Aspergillus lucknowensis]|uniref:Glucose-methanol-choline oxidoreductase N-terminal domain-containing protein n=1 Tax=Aspergillus lucknowensis TaxID=176173 RepID=A0ABR4LNS5_9EURO
MHRLWTARSAGLALGLNLVFSAHGRILTSNAQLLPTYDYVIVGGGVSGLTVANRLSEDPKNRILVIEAGDFDQDEDSILIPGLAGTAVGTQYDWNLTYVSNPDAGDREVSIPQGKAVGGSSLLNRMTLDRGSSADYDRWSALGNRGWGWADLFPYFKKSETSTPPSDELVAEWDVGYDESVHGSSGYLQSSYTPWIWPSTKHFVSALTGLGIQIPHDAAGGDAVGGYFTPHNQDPATITRSDARRAYWTAASSRPGLSLITGRRVTRLITKQTAQGAKVTGVEFAASEYSTPKVVKTSKEVILAAGAIHTPQLLQLSGIGDPAVLSELDIAVVADVPGVGRNFQDHLYIPVVFSCDFPLTAANLTANTSFAAESMALYNTHRTGPYSDATGDFLAFLPAESFTTEAATLHSLAKDQDSTTYLDPDTPRSVKENYAIQHALLTDGLIATDQAQIEIIWTDGTFITGLQHPFSRGNVRLASKDPFAAPLADSAFLRNPIDVKILVEAIKFARSVVQTPSLAAFNPVEAAPGADVTSDADLEAYVRGAAESLFHPSGTAVVGTYELGGVVDTEFRVYGVQGLRVVDASVFPMLPATHIQSSVYAVAEKAADAIKSSS